MSKRRDVEEGGAKVAAGRGRGGDERKSKMLGLNTGLGSASESRTQS